MQRPILCPIRPRASTKQTQSVNFLANRLQPPSRSSARANAYKADQEGSNGFWPTLLTLSDSTNRTERAIPHRRRAGHDRRGDCENGGSDCEAQASARGFAPRPPHPRSGRKRPTPRSRRSAEQFQDSPLGRIPSEWEVAPLEILNFAIDPIRRVGRSVES